MILIGVALLAVFCLLIGAMIGLSIGMTRVSDALKLRRYESAVALARDLLKTPDALDLRDRARKIVADHEAATEPERKDI